MNETTLLAVHLCKSCGAATERVQIAPEALISGVIQCPICSRESALNLEIIEPSVKRPPTRDTTSTT